MSISALLLAITTLTNVIQVAEAVRDQQYGATFSITGTVIVSRENSGIDLSFLLADDSGKFFFFDCVDKFHPFVPAAGTVIRISGDLVRVDEHRTPLPAMRNISIVKSTPPPIPITADAAKIDSGCYDNQLISLAGTIRDAYVDDTDRHAHFILLDCHNTVIPLVAFSRTDQTVNLRKHIGRELTVSGPCCQQDSGRRLVCTRYIRLPDIKVVEKSTASRDPFNTPKGSQAIGMSPQELSNFGFCNFSGHVIATWQHRHALLSSDGRLSTVILAEPFPPKIGTTVDVAGFATTDLYNLNLFNAIWRPSINSNTNSPPDKSTAPTITSTHDLFGLAPDGRRTINASAYGRSFRFQGVIKAISSESSTFALAVEGQLLSIDVSSTPHSLNNLSLEDTVDVSGVCIVNRDDWSPKQPFPRTHGILLVVRSQSDIVLISHPSWWTRERLLILLSVLVCLVCAVTVWNFFLNRLAERRGRLLYRERIARDSANLRALERTRLATELHDSISQNLAAISCELTAARRSGTHDPSAAINKLPILERMMQSCRTELRQCLFDLRNNLLDEQDLATAIRKSLLQICDAKSITMRFHLSRSRLHDTTTHAIVRIIRELVSNAMRHGNATNVRICGAIDGQVLKFAVSDNGCGFAPDSRPGPETGHFGLVGIEGRLQNLHGSFQLTSQPGLGTRATFTIPLSDKELNGKD